MNDSKHKPAILWVVQENQVTNSMVAFFKLLKQGLPQINIIFMAPEKDKKDLKMMEDLNPVFFHATREISSRSLENFTKKRDLIYDAKFPDGLKVWKTLLADDLGEGLLANTDLHFKPLKNIKGIILQIPTPLGSSVSEEFIFYSWVKLARDNNTFIAGYELLPLNTRWTMLSTMVDGIIVNNELSYDLLSNPKNKIQGKIWLLPKNETKVFTPGYHTLWNNTLAFPYNFRFDNKIPRDKAIFFIPHNVAMNYEYRKLIEEIKIFEKKAHLMLCVGKDQVRGTHTHQEIVEVTNHKTLKHHFSYSFHYSENQWEIIAANAVLACSPCYSTQIAQSAGIPSYIIDEFADLNQSGSIKSENIEVTSNFKQLRSCIEKEINKHDKVTDIGRILYDITQNKFNKIKDSNSKS